MLLQEMKWPEVARLPKEIPIVIPVASLEQHGPHMPLFTDSLLGGEVVRRAHERLKERIVQTPMIWLGNSHHHMDFPGTFSAEPRTFLDTLNGALDTFIYHGFQRLVFVNGHGGNIVPGQQAVFETRQRHRSRSDLLLLSSTYWSLGSKPWEQNPQIRQRWMGHACEWETSMMLRLAPDLVGDYRNVRPVEFGTSFDPADRGWITKERSVEGHVGDPRDASAEKGDTLFGCFTDDLVRFLERILVWDGSSWSG